MVRLAQFEVLMVLRAAVLTETFHAILRRAGKNAMFEADEFFSARLSNPHTLPWLPLSLQPGGNRFRPDRAQPPVPVLMLT